MEDVILVLGLTDADAETLEREFVSSGLICSLKFESPTLPPGSRGTLEPLTAIVFLTTASLGVLAIWICLEKRMEIVIKRQNTNETLVIHGTKTSNCKAEVLAQLTKAFFAREV